MRWTRFQLVLNLHGDLPWALHSARRYTYIDVNYNICYYIYDLLKFMNTVQMNGNKWKNEGEIILHSIDD